MELGSSFIKYRGYLCPDSVQANFEVIGSNCLRMACNLKGAEQRTKQIEVRKSGDISRTCMGSLCGFKVSSVDSSQT